jgi:hypothetical protein
MASLEIFELFEVEEPAIARAAYSTARVDLMHSDYRISINVNQRGAQIPSRFDIKKIFVIDPIEAAFYRVRTICHV